MMFQALPRIKIECCMSLDVYTLEMCMFAGPSPPLAEAPPAWKRLCV